MINPEIISEINGLKDVKPEIKSFIKWLVEFENEHIDRDRFAFKQEILDEIKKHL